MVLGPQGGGRNVGIARGTIQIDTSALQRQRNIVINAAKQMGDGIKNSFSASASAVNTFNQRLDSTQARLEKMRGSMLAVSAAGGVLSTLGLRAADNIRLLEARFTALTGSQAEAQKLMAEIAKGAQSAGLGVRETQQAFSGLVPAIRDAGGSIEEYIGLTARLATLNTREGTAGAVFAIREALTSGGTDLVSLSERFNLPRVKLRELIEETGSFSKALDRILTEQGITLDFAEEGANSLAGAMNRFRDASTQALERAFKPSLNTATNLVNNLTSALSSVPDIVLQIGGGFTLAATAVATFGLGLERALRTMQALRQSQAAANLGKAGLAGAAVFGGVQAGAFIARQIDPSLGTQAQALDTLKEFSKRIIIILTEGVERISRGLVGSIQKVAEIFLTGRIVIRNAFENIGEGLRQVPPLIIGMFENMIGEVIGLFAGLMESVVNELDKLPIISGGAFRGGATGLRNIATGLETRGESRRDEAAGAIRNLLGPTAEETAAIAQQLDQTFGGVNTAIDGMTESMYDLLFPVQEAEEAIDPTAAAMERLGNQFKGMVERVRKFQEIQREVLTELAREQARIDREREIRSLREQEDFARQRIQQLEDFHRQQARSEADFFRNREDQIADFARDNADALADFEKNRLKVQQDFARDSVEAAEEHEEKLARIARDGRESVLDAASRLDARGVAEAQRNTQRRLEDERDEFAKERENRQEELQRRLVDQQQSFEEQRTQRYAAFQEQLADQQEQYLRQRAQAQEDFNLRLQRDDQERAIRLQRQAEDFAREDALRRQQAQQRINEMLKEANLQKSIIGNMLSTWTNGLQSAAAFASNFVSRLRTLFQNTSAGRAATSFGTGVSNAISGFGTALNVASQQRQAVGREAISQTAQVGGALLNLGTSALRNTGFGKLLGFAEGGVARVSGSAAGLAMVHDRERVLTPTQNAAFEQMARNGAGQTITFGDFHFGDIGENSEDQLRDVVQEAIFDIFSKIDRTGGGF